MKSFKALRERSEEEPSAKEVWSELERNLDNYKYRKIIQEITDDKIYWISKWKFEQQLKWDSFAPVLSKLKKKLTVTNKINGKG